MPDNRPWIGKNVRVVVVSGQHRGNRGRAVMAKGHGKWLIKFDDRFAGTEVDVKDLAPDRDG
jgi:hypothetical protein